MGVCYRVYCPLHSCLFSIYIFLQSSNLQRSDCVSTYVVTRTYSLPLPRPSPPPVLDFACSVQIAYCKNWRRKRLALPVGSTAGLRHKREPHARTSLGLPGGPSAVWERDYRTGSHYQHSSDMITD